MNRFEKEFCNKYWPGLAVTTGIGDRNAQKLVIAFLKASIIEAREDGTFNKPLNHGNTLIEKEKINNETKEWLKPAREDGVSNEDIIWYWNLHEIDRRMLDKIEIYFRTARYLQYKSDGLTEEQAIKKLFKYSPVWGDPYDIRYSSGEDRPLPPELIDRVNKYVINRTDIEKFKKDCEQYSSLNALIRKEIKKGNI